MGGEGAICRGHEGEGQVCRADEAPAPPSVCQEDVRLVGITCKVNQWSSWKEMGENVQWQKLRGRCMKYETF